MDDRFTPFLTPSVKAAMQALVQAITAEAEAAGATAQSLSLAVCCRRGGSAYFDTVICGDTDPALVRRMGELILRTATQGGEDFDLPRPN